MGRAVAVMNSRSAQHTTVVALAHVVATSVRCVGNGSVLKVKIAIIPLIRRREYDLQAIHHLSSGTYYLQGLYHQAGSPKESGKATRQN